MASKIIFIAMLLLPFGEACTNGQEVGQSVSTLDTVRAEATYFDKNINMDSPKNAATIVWEEEIFPTPSRPGTVIRLYEDGSLYSWNSARRAYLDGKPTRVEAPYAWRVDAKVAEKGMSEIKQLIEDGFFELRSVPMGQSQDQGEIQWRTFLADGHTVRHPSVAMNALPPAVQNITVTIQSNIVPGGVPWEQD